MARIMLISALVCFAILLPSVFGQYDVDKRLTAASAEVDSAIGLQPFFMGSRYGRSDPKANKKLRLAPRNDRFFMGSRYGKRNKPDRAQDGTLCEILDGPQHAGFKKHHTQITCVYTGMKNLYSCYNRVKTNEGPF